MSHAPEGAPVPAIPQHRERYPETPHYSLFDSRMTYRSIRSGRVFRHRRWR